jgi:hypothetical protein
MKRRPQVAAQKRFLEHRDRLQALDLSGRFEYIFSTNLWDSSESRSGAGSTLQETETLRSSLPALLRELRAETLLDIPCGDFHWLSDVDLGVSYIGADIVQALVLENTRQYASPLRQFLRLDLTSDELPKADVVLCRDCLVHLSYRNIARAIANIKRSGAASLLMTNFPETEDNRDIEDGDWRCLNFERDPFRFGPPEVSLLENCAEEGGAYNDKSLCLWPVAAIP